MNKIEQIHTSHGLARLLGVDHDKQLMHFLYKRKTPNYTARKIKKRDGTVRNIYVPHPTVKYMQRRLAALLTEIYLPPKNVHGFISKRSVISNAKVHLRSLEVLNIDLHDFFGSINFGRIYGVLQAKPFNASPNIAAILAQLACNNKVLAQGSPSSPIISNIIARQLDRKLIEFSRESGLRYSRYADDITLSPIRQGALTSAVESSSPLKIRGELNDLIVTSGFKVNLQKLRYSRSHQKRQVTGIIINKKLNVKRKYIRKIRAILFDWDINGPKICAEKYIKNNKLYHINDVESALRSIRGRVDWVGAVRGRSDPVYLNMSEKYNYLCDRDELGVKVKIIPNEYAMLQNNVFVVEFDLHQGTAFVLDGVGLVTCAHVCDRRNGKIIDSENREHEVTVKYIDRERDIAILEAKNQTFDNFLNISDHSGSLIGKSVRLVGYPNYSPGRSLHIARGEVISRHMANKQIYVSTEIFAGNSGGPILDEEGGVLAIALRGPGGNATLDQESIGLLVSDISSMRRQEFSIKKVETRKESNNLLKKTLAYIFKLVDKARRWSLE